MKKSERLGFTYIFSERTVSSSLDMAGSKEVAATTGVSYTHHTEVKHF